MNTPVVTSTIAQIAKPSQPAPVPASEATNGADIMVAPSKGKTPDTPDFAAMVASPKPNHLTTVTSGPDQPPAHDQHAQREADLERDGKISGGTVSSPDEPAHKSYDVSGNSGAPVEKFMRTQNQLSEPEVYFSESHEKAFLPDALLKKPLPIQPSLDQVPLNEGNNVKVYPASSYEIRNTDNSAKGVIHSAGAIQPNLPNMAPQPSRPTSERTILPHDGEPINIPKNVQRIGDHSVPTKVRVAAPEAVNELAIPEIQKTSASHQAFSGNPPEQLIHRTIAPPTLDQAKPEPQQRTAQATAGSPIVFDHATIRAKDVSTQVQTGTSIPLQAGAPAPLQAGAPAPLQAGTAAPLQAGTPAPRQALTPTPTDQSRSKTHGFAARALSAAEVPKNTGTRNLLIEKQRPQPSPQPIPSQLPTSHNSDNLRAPASSVAAVAFSMQASTTTPASAPLKNEVPITAPRQSQLVASITVADPVQKNAPSEHVPKQSAFAAVPRVTSSQSQANLVNYENPRSIESAVVRPIEATAPQTPLAPQAAMPTLQQGGPPKAPTGTSNGTDLFRVSDPATSLLAPSEGAEPSLWDPIRPTHTTNSTPFSHRAELVPHVARQLIEVLAQNPGRPVEIALSPQELGRVRMSITKEDGMITVNILAERGETLDLMRRHIDQLGQTFRSMGYEQITFAFDQGAQDGEQPSDTPPNAQGDTKTGTPSGEGAQPENEPTRITLNSAHTSGVDIRL